MADRSVEVVPLATPRLRLRPLALADAPFILGLLNQPSFLLHIGDKGARDIAGAERYLREGPLAMYAEHGLGLLMVELVDGTPIGMCGLLQRPTLPDPDIGYALVPEHWGRGYMVEACEAVLDWGRRTRGLGRVVAIVSPGNAASIKVLEKLGMALERPLELKPGEPVLLYAL